MEGPEQRIALLVDAENAPAAAIDRIVTEAARRGSLTVRRAYGNWATPQLGPWTAVLHTHALRPVQQFPYSTGKNAVDMAMVIDAMDLLHARSVDAFALVSSDADFTPLVLRLLDGGASVYGYGEAKTPKPFVRACSAFTRIGGARPPNASHVPAPLIDAGLGRRVRSAVEAAGGHEGWARLSAVGSRMADGDTVRRRALGFSRFSDLLEALGCYEFRRDGQVVFVRGRRD